MSATKEQERNALTKIRKIIDELGANCYLAMAFDGCFEMAESNIENDFADSPKENLAIAKKQIDKLQVEVDRLTAENEELQSKVVSNESLGSALQALRDSIFRYQAEDKKEQTIIVDNAEHPELGVFQDAVRRHKFLVTECNSYSVAREEISKKYRG